MWGYGFLQTDVEPDYLPLNVMKAAAALAGGGGQVFPSSSAEPRSRTTEQKLGEKNKTKKKPFKTFFICTSLNVYDFTWL